MPILSLLIVDELDLANHNFTKYTTFLCMYEIDMHKGLRKMPVAKRDVFPPKSQHVK